MAASMTPEEIDALLASIDLEEDYEKSQNERAANFGFFRKTDGVYRWNEPPLKYKEKYKSPVIKSENVRYNPPAVQSEKSNSIEAYSVEKYRMKKR